MRFGPAAVIAVCVAGALAACAGGDDAEPGPTVATPKSALAQSSFADCAEFRRYYARALANSVLRECWGCAPPAHTGDIIIAYAASLSTIPAPEPATDAPDFIVADPDTGRVYLLNGFNQTELVTVDAAPAEEMAIVSRSVTPDGVGGEGLYLDDASDRLVVLKRRTATFAGMALQTSELLFYDVSGPDRPVLVDRYDVGGSLLAARRVGRRLHLITRADGYPQALRDDDAYGELVNSYFSARLRGDERRMFLLASWITARIDRAVRDAPLAQLLPVWRRGLDVDAPTPLECQHVGRPGLDAHPGFFVFSSIDLDGGAPAHRAWTGSGALYASADHAYLVQPSTHWWWSEAQRQQSAVYRFRLDAEGPAQPAGHTIVDGHLGAGYAQSSGISEHDGRLRFVATERLRDSEWQTTSHLFVLGPTDSEPFDVVGQLRDFAATGFGVTRFFGNLGLADVGGPVPPMGEILTLDLADPAQPALAGSITLRGSRNYLYPLGEDHLVAQGRALSPEGYWLNQIELQVLDAADPAAVQVVSSAAFGEADEWAWGVTYYEPGALALAGDVLAVPLQIGSPDAAKAFSGFVVYRVTAPGTLTELGRTDHKAPDGGDGCIQRYNSGTSLCDTFAPVSLKLPIASLRVDEAGGRTVLYTLSGGLTEGFLKADEVGDSVQPLRTLSLAPSQ